MIVSAAALLAAIALVTVQTGCLQNWELPKDAEMVYADQQRIIQIAPGIALNPLSAAMESARVMRPAVPARKIAAHAQKN